MQRAASCTWGNATQCSVCRALNLFDQKLATNVEELQASKLAACGAFNSAQACAVRTHSLEIVDLFVPRRMPIRMLSNG